MNKYKQDRNLLRGRHLSHCLSQPFVNCYLEQMNKAAGVYAVGEGVCKLDFPIYKARDINLELIHQKPQYKGQPVTLLLAKTKTRFFFFFVMRKKVRCSSLLEVLIYQLKREHCNNFGLGLMQVDQKVKKVFFIHKQLQTGSVSFVNVLVSWFISCKCLY